MLFILLSTVAWGIAQAASSEATDVVLTVSAEALPLSTIPASVMVLSREFITNSNSENVTDLLRQVPFLHLSQTGG